MITGKNKSILFMVIIVICFSVMFMTDEGCAKEIIVKQLGGGDYRTIGDAITYADPDDTIMVYHGRYEEEIIIDKDLTVKGVGPQVVEIYILSDGIKIKGNVSRTIISGFSITASKHGIYLESSPDETMIRITNNIIYSCGLCGIKGVGNGNTTVNIINCSIVYNGVDGVSMHDEHTYLYNNIIVSNDGYGITGSFDWGGDNFSSMYNDVWNNVSGNYGGRAHASLEDISQNPQFIDSSIGNYVLQEGSLCMNAGRPGAGDADPDGSRNDMGAYGGPDAASFWPYPPGGPIITNLSATPTSVPKGSTITIEATGEVYE